MLPSRAGVTTTSVLTTGDSVGGYRMVGVPDGLGAFQNNPGDPNFSLVMDHEIGATAGVVRSHGSKGAFVSRWSIAKNNLSVSSGRDHLASPNSLFTWNGSTHVPGTSAMDRFCSADLAAGSAYFANGKGTDARIFLSGEETGPPFANEWGRLFAHIVSGAGTDTSYQLPRFGKISWENAVANPFPQDKTIVMGMDDSGRDTGIAVGTYCTIANQTNCLDAPSELYMYVGTKQTTGSDIERAGLTNGNLFGVRVKVNNVAVNEHPTFVFGTSSTVTSARFELHNFGDVSNKTGVQQQDEAITNGVTQFIRPEDGAWDPRPGKERDFYFLTTGRITTSSTTWRPSRLWRLRFDNIATPEAGGTIEMLLTNHFYAGAGSTPDNDPEYQMFDNMAIDTLGRIVLQEDVGGNDRLGRIYVYSIDSGSLVQVAAHNPKFFKPGGAGFLTNDEETSGVVDASSFLGAGWFLLSVQNHRASADPELVEGGQLVAMFIDPSLPPAVPNALACNAATQLGDFNSDNRKDLVFRRSDGLTSVFFMNGAQVSSSATIGQFGPEWTLVGIGDFNGDGKSDLLTRRTDGSLAMYLMNGTNVSAAQIMGNIGNEWTVVGVGDFNGDGRADFLTRRSDGTLAVYLLNGFQVIGAQIIGHVGTEWTVAQVADFNGDGRADFLARRGDGMIAVYLMAANGQSVASAALLGAAGTEWRIIGAGDFNGDGRSDFLARRADGTVAIYLTNGTQVTAAQIVGNIGPEWKFVGIGDLNADARADLVFRRTDGTVSAYLINGLQIVSAQIAGHIGTEWDNCYGQGVGGIAKVSQN